MVVTIECLKAKAIKALIRWQSKVEPSSDGLAFVCYQALLSLMQIPIWSFLVFLCNQSNLIDIFRPPWVPVEIYLIILLHQQAFPNFHWKLQYYFLLCVSSGQVCCIVVGISCVRFAISRIRKLICRNIFHVATLCTYPKAMWMNLDLAWAWYVVSVVAKNTTHSTSSMNCLHNQ